MIPDNLASSGGLLVSLSEMLQNSAGQNWDRPLEEHNLYEQLSRSYDARPAARRPIPGGSAPPPPTSWPCAACTTWPSTGTALEALSAQLKERIRPVGEGEQVLILSDNDEDGVASAAILHT